MAASPDEPQASVQDLSVTFRRSGRDLPAVRGVSLEIRSGEIVALVGESGSGKTVLGLTLLGLLPGTLPPRLSGAARVCGVDMVSASNQERRRLRRTTLGAVFQDPMTSLNPTMRIGTQIAEVAGSPDGALELLRKVRFPAPERRLRAYPHELSGGLRQRVMLAMALAGSPSLIVADEPTTALDVTVQSQILALLRDLRDELGCSFLLITHDLGVAAGIADRIAVMYAGRVVEVGPALDVVETPDHPYTLGLWRSRLTMTTARDRPIPTLSGEPPDPLQLPPGCPFAPRCPLHVLECDERPPDLMPRTTGEGTMACIRGGDMREASEAPAPVAVPADAPDDERSEPVVVSLRGVSKHFRVRKAWLKRERLRALHDVDLELRAHESLAVVGESGCGKSTLLRIVAGLLKPDHGEVAVGGDGLPQMVFQDAGSSLTPWLTVGEQVGERLIAMGLGRQTRRRRVWTTLESVGVRTDLAGLRPRVLSGGQRQRAAMARAVVVPPSVLLCDEPTSALDASLAAAVLNLLRKLRRELRMAVVFVTHDLGIARLVSDRIAVMYLGHVVEMGPTEEVLTAPVHPYTRLLVSAVDPSNVPMLRDSGEPASPLAPPPGCPFHPRCPRATEECRVTMPPLVQERAHHHAACWHPLEPPGGED